MQSRKTHHTVKSLTIKSHFTVVKLILATVHVDSKEYL